MGYKAMLIPDSMLIWTLNLRHLRALASIKRLGSISAAAQEINISQPAITQALAKLERQFDQPLFDRRSDGMIPCPPTLLLTPRIDAAIAHIASARVTMAGLRALIALADAGSYARAAAATGLAQPSLHRAITDLSIGLNRTLVERRGKGIAFTDAGRRTVRAFRLACAELDAGLVDIAALAGHETGKISIGAMPLSRARLLPAAVTAFHRRFPDVAISIVEGSWHELIDPLRDGTLDCLVGALRDSALGDDVVQQRLMEDHPIIIGRKAHPLASFGSVIGAETLARFPWVMPGLETPLRRQWDRLFTEANLALPDVPIECGSVITIRQILMNSDFLTLLSRDQVAVELEAGWLTQIATTPDWLTRTIGTTIRTKWRPTALQAAFMAILEETASGS
jgi:LysR family transcriptional regulator, regulator for genes of the gallate degradation pathway